MGVLPVLLALAANQPQLVLVPTSSAADTCAPSARIASVIAMTPRLRMLRAPLAAGEDLAAARVRLGADLAVAGRRVEGRVHVQLVDAKGHLERDVPGDRADPVADALGAVWPKDRPPLLEARALGVPNDEAIVAACAGDAERAYALSGAAVGRTIPTLLGPPAKLKTAGLLVDWAKATAFVDRGDCRRALPLLEKSLRALERGDLAPVWRVPPGDEELRPSSLAVIDDLAIAYFAGTFVAMDLLTGAKRWSHDVGVAEPNLIETHRVLIAATEKGLIAIDRTTGRIAWQFDAPSPAPEIVEHLGRLFVATAKEVVALERGSGRVAWRFDPLVTPVGGPVLVDRQLAIPAGAAVVFLDPTSGDEIRRVDLGDEIAAPLTATPGDSVWAIVGSDEIVRLNAATGLVDLRTSALLAAAWPPAVIAEQLVVAAQYRRRPVLAWVDPAKKDGVGRTVVGGLPPIVAMPDYSGVLYRQRRPAAIVARDLLGNTRWTARFPGEVASMSAHGDVVVGAVGRQAVVLDRKKGTRLATLELDARIVDIVYAQTGGAAVTEDGAVYGLPSGYDPRPTSWLRDARVETAACRLALGRTSAARALAKKVVERDDGDLDAQVILAGATPSDADALTAWRTVLERAPRADPVQATARKALAKRFGLVALIASNEPIVDAVLTADTLITRDDASIVARDVTDWTKVRWKNDAQAIEVATDQHVILGAAQGRSVRIARTGQTAPVDSAKIVSGALFSVDDGSVKAIGPDGSSRWATDRDPALLVRAANGAHVLLAADTKDGPMTVLDVETGAARFTAQTPDEIRAGYLVGDVAVLQTPTHFVLVNAATGRIGRRVLLPKNGVAHALATPHGVVFASESRVFVLDVARGRLVLVVNLRAPPKSMDFVGTRALWVQFADDQLGAFDLARRQRRGRVDLGRLTKLVSSATHVAALDARGALWLFDGERALRR